MPNLSPQHFGDFWYGGRNGGFLPSVPTIAVGITEEQWDEGLAILAHPDRWLEESLHSEDGAARWFWYLLLLTPNGGEVLLDECPASGVFRVSAERPDGARHKKESAYCDPIPIPARRDVPSKYEEKREKEDAEQKIAQRRREVFVKAVDYVRHVARSMAE